MVGQRLSDGETLLRAAGLLTVRRVDASGQGREILQANNWIIVKQDPPAGQPTATGTVMTLAVSKPTDGLPTISPTKGMVPDVVCRDLQTAQDALRAAGYYLLSAKDGLGRNRYPLLDRDWIVVGQSIPAGVRMKYTQHIELTVVKYGEPTGTSGCRS